jgi:hypothetical protein
MSQDNMQTTSTTNALTVHVALPANITRIEAQADLYGYGVALLGFVEVADEQEAIEVAGARQAFLLKSRIRPVWYLIFPHAVVEAVK